MTNQIEKAVKDIKEFYGDALYSKDAGIVTKGVEVLLNLAQQYLKEKNKKERRLEKIK